MANEHHAQNSVGLPSAAKPIAKNATTMRSWQIELRGRMSPPKAVSQTHRSRITTRSAAGTGNQFLKTNYRPASLWYGGSQIQGNTFARRA